MTGSDLAESRSRFGGEWERLLRAVHRELGFGPPASWLPLVAAFAAGVALASRFRRAAGAKRSSAS